MEIRKNNMGYTLLELMVTIAVMSVITGFSINAYYWLKQSDVKTASKNITTLMSYTRTNTMSVKADWEMEIYKDGKKYYCVVKKKVTNKVTDPITGALTDVETETKVREEELGSRVTIYKLNAAGTETKIDEANPATLKFQMSTGGVAAGDAGYRVEVGDRKVTIKLVKLTGAYYIE